MGYNYNGRLRSAELLLKEDGSVEMIRRAETPADYLLHSIFRHNEVRSNPCNTKSTKNREKK